MGSSDMWSSVIPTKWLCEWSTKFVPLPGHQKGSYLPSDYTIRAFADHVLSQIHFSPGDTLLLVGHSMGGYIATDIAARFPNETHALVLYHSKISNDSKEKQLDRARAIELSQANTPLYISTMLRNTISQDNISRVKSNLDAMIQSALDCISHECIRACHTAMMHREDRTATIRDAGIKRYYFLGSNDNAIPLSSMEEELSQVPTENIWIEKGCGHMGHIEAVHATRKFFERLNVMT